MLERWKDTLCAARLRPDTKLYGLVKRRHEEPFRRYHTLDHVAHCLDVLAVIAPARDPEAELAIWFHDTFSHPQFNDNEIRSARFAFNELAQLEMPAESIQRIAATILLTDHVSRVGVTMTEMLVLDADLSILWTAPEIFDDYCAKIREEYHFVPAREYRAKRIGVLSRFLLRAELYQTPRAQELLDERARQNLRREIERLGKEGE